jgi:hypothetical protein
LILGEGVLMKYKINLKNTGCNVKSNVVQGAKYFLKDVFPCISILMKVNDKCPYKSFTFLVVYEKLIKQYLYQLLKHLPLLLHLHIDKQIKNICRCR